MIVYLVTNKINNKVYIGQSVRTLAKRKLQHLGDARRGSKLPIHCAIREYGAENFTWEEIYHADNLQDLNAAEEYLIAEYESRTKGYNIMFGGDNRRASEETRAKISAANKGRTFSDESRKKMSDTRRGKNTGEGNYFFGKTHSSESRKKMSAALKGEKNPNFGKPMSEEQKTKLSNVNKGKTISKETRAKISTTLKGKGIGEKNPNFGKPMSEEQKTKIGKANKGRKHSAETRAKMSEMRKGENSTSLDRKIYAFRHTEYGLAFCTRYDLYKEFGIRRESLCRVISGKRKHTGGWSLATPEYIQTLRETTGERICNQ